MKKQNIIYIDGDNSFLIQKEKDGLVRAFREKYGKENIEICNLDTIENYQNYENNFYNLGIFQEKRMFLFFGGRQKKGDGGFESNLDRILAHLADDDFLLFYHLGNGEENLKKWLIKNASLREKNISWNEKDWGKYISLSPNIIKKVLTFYKNQEKMREKGQNNKFLCDAIFGTLEKLTFLEKENFPISDEIIGELSYSYDGAKIFDFIDAIMQKNLSQINTIFSKIKTTSDYSTIDMFIASLLGILRKNLYIVTLRDQGFSQLEISKNLTGINPYVLQKAYQSRIQASELTYIFKKIVCSNIAYKTGKGMKKSVLGRLLEIDTAIFILKK